MIYRCVYIHIYICMCMCMCKYYIIHARFGFFVSIHLGFVLLHCLCLHGSGMNSGFWTGLGSWNHTNHQISWNRCAFWNPLQNYHLRWRRYYSPDICQMFFDLECQSLKILGLCYLHSSKDQMQIENQKFLHSHFKFNALGCSEWQTKGSDFPVQHKRKLVHWKSNRANCDLFLFAIDLDIHVRVPYWLIQLRRPLNFLGEHFIN